MYCNLSYESKIDENLDDNNQVGIIVVKIHAIEEYFKQSSTDSFFPIIIKPDISELSQTSKRVKIHININVNKNNYSHIINILFPSMRSITLNEYHEMVLGFNQKLRKNFTVVDSQDFICGYLLKYPLDNILNSKCSTVIFLKMIIQRFFYRLVDYQTIPAKLLRLKDVLLMMILFHIIRTSI